MSPPQGAVAKRRLRKAVVSLIEDTEFAKAITYSTNSTIPVQMRFEMMEQAIGAATEA